VNSTMQMKRMESPVAMSDYSRALVHNRSGGGTL
jgi:hypothetical protein